MLVIKNLQKLKTRIVQQNIPYEIERLQCIFFESFSTGVLAVYEISRSYKANTPGMDGKFFKTLKNKKDEFRQEMLKGGKYHKSGKTLKFKKDLPFRAVVTDKVLRHLKTELVRETLELRLKLLQQCNLKTLGKNYKGNNLK